MIENNSNQIKALVLDGVAQLNEGEFFTAHETLETAWHLEKAPIRVLYQGLIQFSVACFHAERKNWVGARRLLQKARKNLLPSIDTDSMIDVPDVLLQIENFIEIINKFLVSNVTDQEIVVSPQVKLKSRADQGFIPGSG